MKVTQTTYLSLGSNQGNKLKNLQLAVDQISSLIGKINGVSSVYKTKSWGFESNDFLNICIAVSTNLSSKNLWEKILEIETSLGRKRKESSLYIDRIIDIDVLLFNDEIIFSDELFVPHKKMLDRKFVLVPLAEIAPEVIHPVKKKSIAICLENCTDDTLVNKITEVIKRPISLDEKYNYIAIEGNIGAGKTTLANMIGGEFNARLVLERFADNPFLPKFYEDKDRYAFPLEMSFLADRYQQLSDGLAQFDLFKNLIISDYYIFKSLIFSQITLQKDEFNLYRRMFDVMYKEITKPDLYIYLYQNTERLLENIKKRGRDYEQNIEGDYLDTIHKGYFNFIKTQPDLNSLVIDVSDMDFVKNESDYNLILNQIKGFE
jgi:2-amino-4-hydroxy-6-hydroxymethyldihydropteridine diphosphokinase